MAEFQVGDVTYRSRKMNARQQFHVARRLAPLISHLATLGPELARLGNVEGEDEAAVAARFEAALLPMAEALAKVADAEADYVLDQCMQVVQRLQTNGANVWVEIWSQRANRMAFDDIELPQMMQIAMHVLTENLMGFFGAAPLPSLAPTAPPATGMREMHPAASAG